MILDQILCIYYLVQFRKLKEIIKVLIKFDNKINAMTLAYAQQLCLRSQSTDVGAQKIDNLLLKTFEIVIAAL